MLDTEPYVSTRDADSDTTAPEPHSVRDRVDRPEQYQNWREYAFSEFPEGEDRQV